MERTPISYTLRLLGTFRLLGPAGLQIEISSRKGMALIAMLATSDDGERARSWLQDRLWGSRQQEQARGSLRRELSELRKRLNTGPTQLLICKRDRVGLALEHVSIDARAVMLGEAAADEPALLGSREFLEGVDIAGEEGFEEWLRAQRRMLAGRAARARAPASSGELPQPLQPVVELPARIVDVSQPAAGFGGRPALAVLPFRNLTGEPGNDYLSEGLSEDLIDRLSRLRWLPVIARSSSFAFGGDSIDHRIVSRQLGAKYLFEGRIRRAATGFSLAVELSDAETQRVLWSHRMEEPSLHAQQVQAQIVASLVGALDTRIDTAEQASAHTKSARDLSVSDLIWRGRWHINRLTREDAERARVLFRRALELEPESAEALIQVAWALGRSIWAERGAPDKVAEMRDLAHRAMRADPEDGRGHWLAGVAEMWFRRPSRAKALFHSALALNPSLAEAHAQLGDVHTWDAEPELALEAVRAALRLSPTDLLVFAMLSIMATAHWMLGAYVEAIDHAEQAIIRRPGYWYGHVIKINALADLGDHVGAARALSELLAVKPKFEPDYVDWVPFVDPAWTARLKQGLALAAAQRHRWKATEPAGDEARTAGEC